MHLKVTTSFFRRAFSAPSCLRQLSCGQLVKQGLSLFQIERVEALGEPTVDRSEKIAGLTLPSTTARQARSCEMSLLVWSGISSVAMMLTTAQRAM
jgi:hypothetical protein